MSLASVRGCGLLDVVLNSHLLPTRVARPLLFSAPHAPTPNSFQLESRDQRELGPRGAGRTRGVQVRGWGDVWRALEAGAFIWASLKPREPSPVGAHEDHPRGLNFQNVRAGGSAVKVVMGTDCSGR